MEYIRRHLNYLHSVGSVRNIILIHSEEILFSPDNADQVQQQEEAWVITTAGETCCGVSKVHDVHMNGFRLSNLTDAGTSGQ